ncbi:hypothetical protein D9Y95_RS13810 [Enterococcus hirae]
MTDFEKKEEKMIEKIARTIEKLDIELEKIDSLDEKKHKFKNWIAEKKAIHEIKRLLHEVGKYDRYDEKEMEKAEKYFDSI